MSQATTLPQRVAEFVGQTNAALEKAAAVEDMQLKKAAACSKLIPQAVQALIENDRMEPQQKEAALRAFTDPEIVLKALIKTAQHRNHAEMQQLGQPVDAAGKVKQASATNNYVGARNPTGIAESTANLFRGLGLPVPSN